MHIQPESIGEREAVRILSELLDAGAGIEKSDRRYYTVGEVLRRKAENEEECAIQDRLIDNVFVDEVSVAACQAQKPLQGDYTPLDIFLHYRKSDLPPNELD